MIKPEARLEQARMQVEHAKRRFASTSGALQHRLKPGVLMNDAWEGVRDKGSEVADGAVAAVKERPLAASGILAALVVFVARAPLRRAVSSVFSRKPDESIVTTKVTNDRTHYDITAPAVERTEDEGVSA